MIDMFKRNWTAAAVLGLALALGACGDSAEEAEVTGEPVEPVELPTSGPPQEPINPAVLEGATVMEVDTSWKASPADTSSR